MERLAACLKYCELRNAQSVGKSVDYMKYIGIWHAIFVNSLKNSEK